MKCPGVTAADGTGFVIAGTRDTWGLVAAGLGATLPIGKSASAYVRYHSVLHTGNVNVQSSTCSRCRRGWTAGSEVRSRLDAALFDVALAGM